MAEATLFSVATKLLSTIASPALRIAYKRSLSIWDDEDELDKLRITIRLFHGAVLDAESRQEHYLVKRWIKDVRELLYDADDLFDEVTTNDQLKQQRMMKRHKHSGKVRVFSSGFNPMVSSDSIAKRVKAIRMSLHNISCDIILFGFVHCHNEKLCYRIVQRKETHPDVDPQVVVGREDEENAIIEFLFEDLNEEQNIPVIAVVGIGGMGKTTVAQLVFNNDEVRKRFGERRWWVCISGITDEKKFLERIFQAMYRESYQNLNVSQLQSKIVESLNSNGVFLLVLDGLWDYDYARWEKIKSLLNRCAKGSSRIIVTTRDNSVARGTYAVKTHLLGNLSYEKSWELFKMFALDREQENDPRWTSLGKEVVKRCAGVPLAIRTIGSLLYGKTTQEWVSFKNNGLSGIDSSSVNEAISNLKLSYDHLSSDLKQCFAYCCLFPKDCRIHVRELIYLWIAQGYVKQNNEVESIEEAGHAYFIKLLAGSFFQVVEEDGVTGEILYCKMHSLFHDLAQLVAGDESIILSEGDYRFRNPVRHLSVAVCMDRLESVLPQILDDKRLRSLLFLGGGSISPLIFDERRRGLHFLRSLNLSNLRLEDVSGCISDLVHLRYLNLSHNNFRSLPDSLTRIWNLLALDISGCQKLESLPEDFAQLINLRHLDNKMCYNLTHIPRGFEEMTSLQRLSYFKVSKACEFIKLDIKGLAKLKLRGELEIEFSTETEEGLDVDDNVDYALFGVSPLLKGLKLSFYPMSMLFSMPTNLVSLELSTCRRVKYLPSFDFYHSLRRLILVHMDELQYVLEGSGYSSFPSLVELELRGLPKLNGWSLKGGQPMASLPCLLRLAIGDCPNLKSFPPAPELESLKILGRQPTEMEDSGGLMAFSGLCLTSLLHLHITKCNELKKLHLAPSSNIGLGGKGKNGVDQGFHSALSHVEHRDLPVLECFEGEALTSLSQLRIEFCNKLKDLYLPQQPNAVEELWIQDCAELETFHGETLTSLQRLHIVDCSKLKNVQLPPPSVNLIKELDIWECPELEWVQVGALTFLRQLRIEYCSKLKKLNFPPHPNALKELRILGCPELETFQGQSLTSLQRLEFCDCSNLTKVLLPTKDQNVIEHLTIRECRRLKLWNEGERGLDWNSLSILYLLTLSEESEPEKFPDCLQERKDRSELCINNYPLLTGCRRYYE